jgi:hypothetical protein
MKKIYSLKVHKIKKALHKNARLEEFPLTEPLKNYKSKDKKNHIS